MANDNVSDISSGSVSSRGTVDIHKYVSQLEKRVSEQETLIELLKEKVAALESRPAASSSMSESHGPYSRAVRTPAAPEATLITGSRKSNISAVQITKYSNFFITRINPSVSAAELSNDLLTYAPDLKSVICSKISTKHPSYSSFHLTVPEEQKILISNDGAWPEGALVKPFIGKLLKNYVLEKYDSLNPGGSSLSQEIDPKTPSAPGDGPASSHGHDHKNKSGSRSSSRTVPSKVPSTIRTFEEMAEVLPSANSSKNGVQTRSNLKK